MNIKTKDIYSELYQLLNLLGDEYINKLPHSLFNMVKEKRNINYNPEYTDNIPLSKQNIKKETLSIIALLHLNYWCENEKEKFEIKQLLKNNQDRYEEEIRDKYNPDNIFKKHTKDTNSANNVTQNEVAMIQYKESLFKKILSKIKSIFNKSAI